MFSNANLEDSALAQPHSVRSAKQACLVKLTGSLFAKCAVLASIEIIPICQQSVVSSALLANMPLTHLQYCARIVLPVSLSVKQPQHGVLLVQQVQAREVQQVQFFVRIVHLVSLTSKSHNQAALIVQLEDSEIPIVCRRAGIVAEERTVRVVLLCVVRVIQESFQMSPNLLTLVVPARKDNTGRKMILTRLNASIAPLVSLQTSMGFRNAIHATLAIIPSKSRQ
jgi:hypothetical protein